MDRQSHLKVDKFFWNDEYNEVHKWIDGTYPRYKDKNPYYHWLDTHNMEAIKNQFGEYTMNYNSAYLHILSDFLSHFQIAFVPKDKKELIEMLVSLEVISDPNNY